MRIELRKQGEWVEVKRRLSYRDIIELMFGVMSGMKADRSVDARNAVKAAEFATLDLAIKAWSFPEPVTPESIRTLTAARLNALKERLNELSWPESR